MPKRTVRTIIGVGLLVLSVTGGLAQVILSKKQSENYSATVLPLLEEWDDAVSVASQTPRIGLPNVIPNLQEIKRRASQLEAEGCFAEAHPFLIEHMEYTIKGFLAFMGQESDSLVQEKFTLAGRASRKYTRKLQECTK